VLEEMRETGAAKFLVARTDVVINDNGNNRHCGISAENYAQAVTESELFDWCYWELKVLWHVLALASFACAAWGVAAQANSIWLESGKLKGGEKALVPA
jgi:hypothetical protein